MLRKGGEMEGRKGFLKYFLYIGCYIVALPIFDKWGKRGERWR